ncbi:MAG: nucleotidyl transferase AbiEii/AbiGii toxin family protein, partial [Alphaproteobacteria bacterium]|nr:nucleotidyl transferase AbiEii/AbiGii toxin family protein [Alphaproteobacteria bacterium]
MTRFAPRLDILPPAQRRLWDALSAVPPEFVLYGGTAIALHLGHRRSVDFDFFGEDGFDRAVPPEFVLYGGTAIALHLGHRRSVDFDFFGEDGFDRAV